MGSVVNTTSRSLFSFALATASNKRSGHTAAYSYVSSFPFCVLQSSGSKTFRLVLKLASRPDKQRSTQARYLTFIVCVLSEQPCPPVHRCTPPDL